MTNKTEKLVNYTPEMTATAVEMYTAGEAVEQIAGTLGRTVRSVIAKLSREGVYKAKNKDKAGARATKSELVEGLAAKLGVDVAKVESLEKATREALELVFTALPMPEHVE